MVLARSKLSDEEYRASTEDSIDKLANLLEELGYLGVRAHSSNHIVDLATRKMRTFQKLILALGLEEKILKVMVSE